MVFKKFQGEILFGGNSVCIYVYPDTLIIIHTLT